MSPFALVLAAGESLRFGSSKQLAVFDGMPLAGRALRLAEQACGDRTVLVVGHDSIRVLAACAPLKGFFTCNDDYRSGLSSSIACGVRSVAHTADAVLLLMSDQPLVSASHLEALLATWEQAPCEIIASEYEGIRGPPAVFPAAYFAHLMALEGDRGARALLDDARNSVRGIACEAAAIDIDRPDDLAALS